VGDRPGFPGDCRPSSRSEPTRSAGRYLGHREAAAGSCAATAPVPHPVRREAPATNKSPAAQTGGSVFHGGLFFGRHVLPPNQSNSKNTLTKNGKTP